MRLDEFNKPDYANMSEEELHLAFTEGLAKLESAIDKSNNRIENGLRSDIKNPLRQVSQTYEKVIAGNK